MASSVIIYFLLLSLSLFSLSCLSAPQTPNTKPHPFILPINKDPSTNLFYTSLGIGTPRKNFNLAIDLAGENLWYNCDTNYNSSSYIPIACGSKQCPDVACIGCNGPFKPGCTNNTCPGTAFNSLAKFIFSSGLGEDILFISQNQVSGLLSSCIDVDGFPSFTGDESPLNGLPKNTNGIIGLSRSNFSLPIQLALKNKLPPKFSLCLPSSNKQGFTNLLVGSVSGDPFKELSKFVQTTPLIVNPVSTGSVSVKGVPSDEYFIDVKAIKIDGNDLNLKPSLLSIDKKGNGGTKISTLIPFTELQSSVYKPFIRDFLKKASDRKLKRVTSVAPFEACFDSTSIENSVPRVDLELQGGVQWTIHERNLMVNVKKNVACLAFVEVQTMDSKLSSASSKEEQSLSSGRKHGGWISFPFFIGMVGGFSLANAGIVGNLIVYLIREFNIKSINAAQIVNVVSGSTNLIPLVAAIVADSFFGSFSVAFASSCVALLGTIILFLTSTINSLKPHPCSNDSSIICKPPTGIQYTVLYISIVLISIGFGGSRFTAASLGANQFDKPEHQGTFFNWFFFTFYVASGVALTGVVYLEDNLGWALGFGICALATFVGTVVFLLGYRFYRVDELRGSAVLDLGRVFVASVRKWKCNLSYRVEDYYTNTTTSHDVMVQMLPPATLGKRFRFFNRAALITDADLQSDGSIKKSSWRLCTIQQVEDLKKIIGILPLWTSSIFLATPIAIQSSLTVLQALVMDRSLGSHFKIPPGSVLVIVLISTSIFLTIVDRVLLPGWHKVTGKSPMPLQRIGVGHVFNVLSMVVSALVESKRLKLAHRHVDMSVLWLFPQLVLVGIGEAFHFPGQVTFYYQQFPQSLRSTSTAMISMLIGIAFYLSTALIDQVRRSTHWLPDDINHGKVDNVYWMLVLFGGINFVYYLLCSAFYKYDNV